MASLVGDGVATTAMAMAATGDGNASSRWNTEPRGVATMSERTDGDGGGDDGGGVGGGDDDDVLTFSCFCGGGTTTVGTR